MTIVPTEILVNTKIRRNLFFLTRNTILFIIQVHVHVLEVVRGLKLQLLTGRVYYSIQEIPSEVKFMGSEIRPAPLTMVCV